jgi:hypothetical protein
MLHVGPQHRRSRSPSGDQWVAEDIARSFPKTRKGGATTCSFNADYVASLMLRILRFLEIVGKVPSRNVYYTAGWPCEGRILPQISSRIGSRLKLPLLTADSFRHPEFSSCVLRISHRPYSLVSWWRLALPHKAQSQLCRLSPALQATHKGQSLPAEWSFCSEQDSGHLNW